jgi:pentatricopeptide repeat protein
VLLQILTTVPATHLTFTFRLAAYEKGRQYERALALFHEQLENNVDPDAITFASLLNACDRAGVCEKAVELIEKMHSLGIAGPPGMYNTVIASCSSHWEHALRVFLSMQCAGVDVSSQTVNLLLAALCAGGQRDHALWLLRETINLGWPLSLAAYTSLLQLLSDCGDWVWASIVFSRMQMFGGGWIDANVAQALIRAHTNGGEHEGAARWATYFSAIGIHSGKPTDGLQRVARAEGEHEQDGVASGSKDDGVEHVPDGQGLLSDGNPG